MPTQNQHSDISFHEDFSTNSSIDFDSSITGGFKIMRPELLGELNAITYNYSIKLMVNHEVSDKIKIISKEQDVKPLQTHDLLWYLELRNKHSENLTQKDIVKVIQGVHNLINEGQYKLLDNIISNTLNEQSSPHAMVTLFRASYSARSNIKSWFVILNNAIDWVKKKGLKPEEVFLGLV